jgi:hypothetical protein
MSIVMSCTPAEHELLKTDPMRLRTETPTQGRAQMFDGEVEFFWRECGRCASSLAVEPAVEAQARETD